jgi:hypothetical protein
MTTAPLPDSPPTLPTAPSVDGEMPPEPPPPWRRILFSVRWVLLSLYLLVLGGAVTWWMVEETDEWFAAAIAVLILLGLQGVFLVGMPHFRWPKPTGGVPMVISMSLGALLAGLLTFGVFATMLNLFDVWERLTNAVELGIFWVIAVAWGGWFFVFLVMWAGEWLHIFRRIYKLLVAGTVLELLVTIPVDVHVRRRTSCYCGEGTFFAMVIGISVAVWSFGPGLVMLFLTRRLQRKGYFSICRKCTYDLRGQPPGSDHCPECGARIPKRYRPI